MVSHRLGRFGLLACSLALVLTGCGRRGPLEPPPNLSQAPAPDAAQARQQTVVLQNTDNPGLIQSPNTMYEQSALAKLNSAASKPPARPINTPPVASPNAFILDPLVK